MIVVVFMAVFVAGGQPDKGHADERGAAPKHDALRPCRWPRLQPTAQGGASESESKSKAAVSHTHDLWLPTDL